MHVPTRQIPTEHNQGLLDFTSHLICDLRAPLASRDKNDETCIHIAAEHGNSVDLLYFLLACDTTGSIRQFKNSRGLTVLEVAKSEYFDVFGNGDNKRPSSALSNHTIRPFDSSAICSTDSFNSTLYQLLTSLRVTSPSSLEKMTHQCDQIIQHFRDGINAATKVFCDLKKNADAIDTMRNKVLVTSWDKSILRGIFPKKRHQDSEDSQHDSFFDLQLEAGTAGLRKPYSFLSSISRVKAWLTRMVALPRRLEIVFDIDEKNCAVGREDKCLQGPPTICSASIDKALTNSQVVLEAAKRDLESIKKYFVALKFYCSFLLGVNLK